MKIGVDIRWMVGNYRGMGRFARQLIDPVKESVIALAPEGISSEDWPSLNYGTSFMPWWEQYDLPRLCRGQELDYLLCPYNTGPLVSLGSTRTIAVIHDLIYLQSWFILPPSISPYQTFGRLYRRHIVPAFARRADIILTVSHFTKRELVQKFALSEEDVHVIPNSIADSWFENPVSLQSRQPFIFTVAGESPSKNVFRLLKAFALALPDLGQEAKLKIAGIKPSYQQAFINKSSKLGIDDRVDFLGFISEQELRQYYRTAKCFVFASLFEGFGIPLLEAMSSGTPVACSNTTSIPEVVNDCGLLFNPRSPEDMAEKIRNIWNDAPTSRVRMLAGVERARMFSENSIAQKIDGFWKKLS
jgi:glycosyltransferase involved in cell wall biosynthesis